MNKFNKKWNSKALLDLSNMYFKLKSTIQENLQRKVRELKRQPLIHQYNSIRQCSGKNDQKDLYQIQTIINQKEEIISLNNLNPFLQNIISLNTKTHAIILLHLSNWRTELYSSSNNMHRGHFRNWNTNYTTADTVNSKHAYYGSIVISVRKHIRKDCYLYIVPSLITFAKS